jgi:hypothetical protein
MDLSNKISVFPKVSVYKKCLDDVDVMFDIVKKTESYSEKTHLFSPWNEWLGNWKGKACQVDSGRYTEIIGDDEDAVLQRHFIKNVFETFDAVSKDYLDQYANTDGWPEYIVDWDTENKSVWNEAGISFLRYDSPTEEQTIHSLAMNYHTDTNQDDIDSPGPKLAITVTMYLNDDYEGGEISFYDETENKVYNYKPKAGDVTVFPSSAPYFHGVLPFTGNPRYLLRMFIMYNLKGSEEWFKNVEKFGKEKWAEMEKQRLQDNWSKGKHLRHVEFDKNKPPHGAWKTFFVEEPPIVVD